MIKYLFSIFLLAATTLSNAGLINGGFEQPVVPGTNGFFTFPFPTANPPWIVPGWSTTDTAIEIWESGFNGVTSYEGVQHAEINAFGNGTLFQDSSGILAGSQVGFEFAHRARVGTDVMNLTITDLGTDNLLGGAADTILFTQDYSATTAAWVFNTSIGLAPIFALGNDIRFAYSAISTGSGSASVGNFLDAADFGVGVNTPTCGLLGTPPCATPTPGTLALLGLGLAGLGFARRKKA